MRLRLLSGTEIFFEGNIRITDEVLERYSNFCKGFPLSTATDRRFLNKEAFYASMLQAAPLTIIPEGIAGHLAFEAFFKKFPYSVSGKDFAHFGIRLVPMQGRVESVKFNDGWRRQATISAISGSSNCFSFNLDKSLHMEIFFQPTKLIMEEIGPPARFQEKIVVKDNYID